MWIIRKKEMKPELEGAKRPYIRRLWLNFLLDPVSRPHFKPDRGCWCGSSRYVETQIPTMLHTGYVIAN